MAGLQDLTPDSEESSSGGKSTHVKFWNPRNAADEISEGTEHRNKQEYYDAAQELRNMFKQNINVPVGEFLVAAADAEKRQDYGTIAELTSTMTSYPVDEFVQGIEEAKKDGDFEKLEEVFNSLTSELEE